MTPTLLELLRASHNLPNPSPTLQKDRVVLRHSRRHQMDKEYLIPLYELVAWKELRFFLITRRGAFRAATLWEGHYWNKANKKIYVGAFEDDIPDRDCDGQVLRFQPNFINVLSFNNKLLPCRYPIDFVVCRYVRRFFVLNYKKVQTEISLQRVCFFFT